MACHFVRITPYYNQALRWFYHRWPQAATCSYEQQYQAIVSHLRDPVSALIRELNQYGFKSTEIISNAKPLQQTWCHENHLAANLTQKQIVLHQIIRLRPEILWIDDLTLPTDEFIYLIKKKVPQLKLLVTHHCAPFNPLIISRLKLFDIVFTCVPHLHSEFLHRGLNTMLVYHAFDPVNLRTVALDKVNHYPVVFSGSLYTGSAFHQQRIYYLEKIIQAGIDIKIFANTEARWKFIARKGMEMFRHGIRHAMAMRYYSRILRQRVLPPVFGQEMYSLLSTSHICFNIHGEAAGSSAGNMRLFEATGMGTCLITDWKENLADLFEPEKEVMTYRTVEECIDKIKWLLQHPQQREKIGRAGQQRTLSSHTISLRARTIYNILMKELSKYSK